MLMNFLCVGQILVILLSQQESLAKRKGYSGLSNANGKVDYITFHELSNTLPENNENHGVKKNLTDVMIVKDTTHVTPAAPTTLDHRLLWFIFAISFLLAFSVSFTSLYTYYRQLRKFKDTNNNNIQVDTYIKCPQRKWNPADRSSNSLTPQRRYIHRYQTEKDKKDCVRLFSIISDDDTGTTDDETIIFDIDNIP
ncbi:uncharacterized protein LOC106882842 isoform X1 [Octopus bimaculoides]|uniref:Uncharacterized protein n=1 Tax=Octopus bimaculoides TaxID=37653 RepID=A0A0L8FK31_OCTBM|nr:uncharacterized protein LOC106882842 isoform X1 [Octopus bimaculoides]|eukprot:XP_014789128.1 PREDICTED: uncharacterized protein LOC106882842 isoform X1 [Octopus bimaculoides]